MYILEIIKIIIYILFVTRISYMFVEEKGFYNIFLRLREYAKIYEDEEGNKIIDENGTFLQGVLSCFYCFSMYPSIFIILLHLISSTLSFYIALPFALSLVSIIIYEKVLN